MHSVLAADEDDAVAQIEAILAPLVPKWKVVGVSGGL